MFTEKHQEKENKGILCIRFESHEIFIFINILYH